MEVRAKPGGDLAIKSLAGRPNVGLDLSDEYLVNNRLNRKPTSTER